jgi:REP element-mobilizing transposase RayT
LPLITQAIQARLYPFIASVAKDRGFPALAIGGIGNHIHILLALPATTNLAEAVQAIKGVSSKWINDEFRLRPRFAWQQGYGAFSVSVSQIAATITYINNQKKHHAKRTFEDEFIAFLKKHNVEYDPRYVFG